MLMHCDPRARHIYPSLVLVQPRKMRPCLIERLLMGCKESNQTKSSPGAVETQVFDQKMRPVCFKFC